ncbi:MAG: RNA polymerase sigma factor [Bacteroidetes bacterium]|nr:MAG: RNA polymerase sigma factor [Bacteroidota bacterium]
MPLPKPADIQPLSDEDLVAAYQESGDPAAVGALFERYTHIVFLISMKYLKDEIESEDMVMGIFEKLLTDLRRYEIRSFRYWLHTVVKNQCLIHLDQQKRLRNKASDYEAYTQAADERQDLNHLFGEVDDHEALLQRMEAALTELKPKQRRCLELFYLQQMSYQEVSDATGFSLKEVKSYIQNGKRNLRIRLENQPSEPTS